MTDTPEQKEVIETSDVGSGEGELSSPAADLSLVTEEHEEAVISQPDTNPGVDSSIDGVQLGDEDLAGVEAGVEEPLVMGNPVEELEEEKLIAEGATEVSPVVESTPANAAAEKVAPPSVKEEVKEESAPAGLSEEQANLPWYVVHAYSGYEMRAKLSLEERIRSFGLSHRFGNVMVPEEKIVELVRGEKKTSKRKFFPGYILVQCDLDDETWHLVKETPKVTGFVGDSRNPVPLSAQEVGALLQQMEGGAKRARPSVKFEQGDSIKVVDGPFADFNGTVDEVKPDKGKLRVLISIFGRNTPVELDFVQVEKV